MKGEENLLWRCFHFLATQYCTSDLCVSLPCNHQQAEPTQPPFKSTLDLDQMQCTHFSETDLFPLYILQNFREKQFKVKIQTQFYITFIIACKISFTLQSSRNVAIASSVKVHILSKLIPDPTRYRYYTTPTQAFAFTILFWVAFSSLICDLSALPPLP